ncbi:MAG: MBG-2 domain-containing protein [Verrucomicrobia bacterium]|nr:MBG-2 domain-containing protein [Verrucomicrobiota bacterium]
MKKNLIYHIGALWAAGTLGASAATIVSQVSGGNWNSPSTWIGEVAPTSLDDVHIAPGASVTIDSSSACLSLNIDSANNVGSSLTISASGSLVVGDGDGPLSMGSNLVVPSQEFETTLEVNGTLRCGQIHMMARRIAGKDAECMLRVNNAAALVEVNGDIIQERNVAQGSLRNQIRFGAAGTVRVKGTFIALDEGGIPSVSGPGTIEYHNDGPQQISGFNYNNLTLSGSGLKTGVDGVIISGILTIKDSAEYDGAAVDYELNSSVVYAGTVPQVAGPELPLLAPAGWSFTVSNVLGVTLSQSVSVPGTISLIAGPVFTGPNVLSMVGGLTRVDGYVVGNLQKPVSTGLNVARLYELGSSNGYGPVSLTFSKVNKAGNLTVGSSDGDHASIGTSKLDPDLSVNVKWDFIPGGELATAHYAVQFNYNAADLDIDASPSLLIAGRFSGGVWSYPVVSTRTATSLQLNGLTTFSSVQLAENGQKESAIITWATPASIVYGTPISAAQLNASTPTPGSLTYSPAIGTVLDAGVQTLSVVFNPVDLLTFRRLTNTVEILVQQTALVATADSVSRNYAESNPAFTGTLIGVVNGDDISVTYSTVADETSAAGAFPIVPTLNDPANRLSNYDLTVNNGTLTVIGGVVPVMLSIEHLPGWPNVASR